MTGPSDAPRLRRTRLIAWVLALPLVGFAPQAEARTMLSYISSPYSYVSGGETVSVGSEDGTLIGVHGDAARTLTVSIDQPGSAEAMGRWWFLMLSPPEGTTLSPGIFDRASRWSFQDPSAPGLDFFGNGRGNNTLSGGFRIWEANYSDDGTVLSFAADFLQYDGQDLNSWTKGAIRFNSDVAIDLTPEPIVLPEPIPPVDPVVTLNPPWDPGAIPDPSLGEPVVVIDPVVLLPWPVEPWPEDSGGNDPSAWIPYPGDDGELPIHWFSGSSSSSSSSISFGPPLTIMEFTPYAAPGPLPIAGAIAGWHSARRLRRRCRKPASGAHPRQPLTPP